MTAAGPAAAHGERKRATVLFADLVGFSALSAEMGTEAAYGIATGCLRLMDGIARKHGGAVDKYLGDKLMAVFGAPVPLPHAARSAAAAALEMRERVERYNREAGLAIPLRLHAGINTGFLVSGDIRGPVVREFHVLGDAVNVAARLNAKAPAGAIFVGEETFAETRDEFTYRELAPLALKGKARKVAARSLEGWNARGFRPPMGTRFDASVELVGRDADLARLRARAAALETGRGGVVLLTGAEGIGKSRLLDALAACPELAEAEILSGACAPDGGATPLRSAEALTAAFPALAGFAGAEPSAPGARAVPALLRAACARRPVALLLDDVQWMDPDSLAVLEALLPVAGEAPLLLVVSLQEDPPERVERLARALAERVPGASERLQLGPLDAAATGRLIDQLTGEGGLDAETRRLVAERGAGIPSHVTLAVYLAAALRSERHQAERFAGRTAEAERRRAAVLFADITGFTAMTERIGAERAYPVVAGCLRALDEVARRHGGTVDHYLGDCVLALFGVPEAMEDAPRAALNAAIEMRDRVQAYNREHALEMPLDVHSGIATGLGIAGDVSGPLIREFAVMGDHVDAASRLTDLASAGEIVVDRETHRLTREVFAFRDLEPLPAQDVRPAVDAFLLESRRVRLHRARIGAERRIAAALVGRESELSQLRLALAELQGGSGAAVSVIAEAGIGKSRLVAELTASDEARELRWLEGRALSNGRNLSYHLFADLCRGWAEIDDADDEEAARAKLRSTIARLLPQEVDETLPFLETVLGIPLAPADRERLALQRGEVVERLTHRAVRRVLAREAELRPLVVVLDDLHWADLSSLDLLEDLLGLPEQAPILLLHLFRPGFPETSERILTALRGRQGARHLEIPLAPLDAAATRRLLRSLFREGDLPHATREHIVEKTQGNPFFLEEVVRSLVDSGAVEVRGGVLHATRDLTALAIPGTVQEVVMARVDRLGLERRGVLQAASVIGGTFHLAVLEAMVRTRADVKAAVDALLAAEFIVPDDRMRGTEFSFKHPLVQEVTYDSILEARRRELHGEAAEAIESLVRNDAPGADAMLAWHFSMGGDVARAEEYLFRAGEQAARSAASGEALRFFQEASRLYLELHGEHADPEKKALLARNVARALFQRGQLLAAEDKFNEAIEALGERVPASPAALALRLARRLPSLASRLYLGDRLGRRPPATPAQQTVIALMLERGLCEITADPTRFVLDSLDALALLERLDPTSVPTAGRVLAGASTIFSYSGLSFGLSRRVLDQANALVGEGDPEGLLMFRVANFAHTFFEGDWSPAHDLYPEILENALERGLLWDALTYLGLHTERTICQGRFEQARAAIGRVRDLLETYEHDLARSTLHALTTYLALEEHRAGDALEAAERYYDENPEPLLHVLALAGRGRALAWLGRLEESEATLDRCGAVVAELGRSRVPPYQRSHFLRSRLILDVMLLERALGSGGDGDLRRRRAAAQRTARAALAAASRCAPRRVEVLRLEGTRSWLEGDRRRAARVWTQSLTEARRLGALPELGRTHLEAARRLAGAPSLRVEGLGPTEHLERAREVLAPLGLRADRSALDELAHHVIPLPRSGPDDRPLGVFTEL